jgi:hypothetical protein
LKKKEKEEDQPKKNQDVRRIILKSTLLFMLWVGWLSARLAVEWNGIRMFLFLLINPLTPH